MAKWILRLRMDRQAYDEACEDARRWHAQAKRLQKALVNERCAHIDDVSDLLVERKRLIEERDELAAQVLRLEIDSELRKLWS